MRKRFGNLLLFVILVLTLTIVLSGCGGKSNIGSKDKITESASARKDREEKRKAQYGDFYVPLKPLSNPYIPKREKAKGLYVKAIVAGYQFDEKKIDAYADYIKKMSGEAKGQVDESIEETTNDLEKILAICKATEVNALAIDIKDDYGYVTWPTEIAKVKEIQGQHALDFENYQPLLDYLHENDIYAIARIVAFKDPYLAETMPEHAIQLKNGGVYKDGNGTPWINPYDHFVWDYVLSIAKEAALRGFDEINFDYVRFPDNAATYNPITEFPGRENNQRKDDCIQDFLTYAGKELADYNVFLSADVFGVITHSWNDEPDDIGQTWRKISRNVDVICPMIYPSHYDAGWYGYDVPDQEPYGVFNQAMKEALERNASQENVPVIRPWVQGFTASWVNGYREYTPEVIAEQIVACQELGIDEYLVWNAENHYDPMTFFYHDQVKKIMSDDQDAVGRTADEVLDIYLRAQKKQDTRTEYLLTPVANRPSEYDDFIKSIKDINRKLFDYEVQEFSQNEDGGYTAVLNGVYNSLEGLHYMEEEPVTIQKENGIWKVFQSYIRYEEDEFEPE